MTKLILFDIDGTLLASGGAGLKALGLALEKWTGSDDVSWMEIAGRTDAAIAMQVLERFKIEPTPENTAKFFDTYLHFLEQELPRTPGHLLPGILELLDQLQQHPEVALGLLTGNLERGAQLKLTHYGVWEYFEFGAYADDHHDRNALGNFARDRAKEKHGITFANDEIYILGDTPHDIACARAIGAKAVAIATGDSSREELANHDPDFLFADLADVNGVMKSLGL